MKEEFNKKTEILEKIKFEMLAIKITVSQIKIG